MFLSALIVLILITGSAFLFYKWGWKASAIAIPIIVYCAFNYNKADTLVEIINLIPPLVIGGAGGYIFKTGKPVEFFLIISTLSLAIVFSGNFYYMKASQGQNFLESSKKEVVKLLDAYKVPEEQKKEIEEDLERWAPLAGAIIPFSSVLYALLFSGLGYICIRIFFIKIMKKDPIPGLEFFHLNDYFIFLLIAGWLSFILIDQEQFPLLYIISLNTALITSLAYIIQAIGVIKFLLIKRGLPAKILPVVIILTLLMGIEISLFIAIILLGVGAFDLWADFRKFKKV